MKVSKLVKITGADFFTGVPDSQLKALTDYLMNEYHTDGQHHIIAANEGNAVAAAAGYHLATGRVPAVYLQNSGEGNILNPAASLLHKKVFAIPCIFIIGWRGEPGIHDEPQHVFQGEITCRLLEDMGIAYFIISKQTTEEETAEQMKKFHQLLADGNSAAFLIQKGALEYDETADYHNEYVLNREEVIRHIINISGSDPVISSTGKMSRELYELREKGNAAHDTDFLTVGSMGHCSSIALGTALNRPEKTIWCIDGDGAVLMHMGAMPVTAYYCPKNLIHIVINNGAHETVGGQPTVMGNLDIWKIARECGYPYSTCVSDYTSLDRTLHEAKERGMLSFIEVKCKLESRADLGRPVISPCDNKLNFMRFLKG